MSPILTSKFGDSNDFTDATKPGPEVSSAKPWEHLSLIVKMPTWKELELIFYKSEQFFKLTKNLIKEHFQQQKRKNEIEDQNFSDLQQKIRLYKAFIIS